MTMSLYQPVLFVGLGGSGCDIGAVVERRLREEICGPDGTQFLVLRHSAGMLPYQLPACVQFVYADLNQAELDRMPRRVVPGTGHAPAARRTARYSGLVPTGVSSSYPGLAVGLRLEAEAETRSWLPPEHGEPRVRLSKGSGQLPTVGRAALFSTFLRSPDSPAVRDIRDAVGKLATSGEHLAALGGRAPRAVDVFVAFSVAGGTGAGIFYDYLHLIGHVFRQASMRARIYPLVLMPSAFPEGMGGGRYARLNGGRALLDLSRLVDDQNGGGAGLRAEMPDEGEPPRPDEQAVRYPLGWKVALLPGTVQTAFLFSMPPGGDRADLSRSAGEMVLSLIDGELGTEEEHLSGIPRSSFADWLVNAGVNRQAPAGNGIGSRGVSAARVASLTVPVDDLAGVIAGRLLREAIYQLSDPAAIVAESNQGHIGDFLAAAGLRAVLARDGVDHAEPAAPAGAHDVVRALNDRAEAMMAGIADLRGRLGREVPLLAGNFEPRRAIRTLLAGMDAFHAQRVAFGHPKLAAYADRAGAAELLRGRRIAPQPPPGLGLVPPAGSGLKNRLGRRLRWDGREPAEVRGQQDAWYQWRTYVAWAEAWAEQASRWQRTLADAEDELARLTGALLDFARGDEARYQPRVAELYRQRAGVSYLLPPGGTELERLYAQVLRAMAGDLAAPGSPGPDAAESDVVRALIQDGGGWARAYGTSVNGNPSQAVGDLRELVRERVRGCLRAASGESRPLLPRLRDLLAEASAPHLAEDSIIRGYAEEFRGKLAGLLPAGFSPPGTGPMKVLISYPAEVASPPAERYLTDVLHLPGGRHVVHEMQHTHTESLTVTLLRTEMGLTDAPEAREVIRLWAQALSRPEPADFLRWRQRTGYEFGYLATTAGQRVEILHRLLCALWNGRITVIGGPSSPGRIVLDYGGIQAELRLVPLHGASSWASVLQAYELWALDDDDTRRRLCTRLMGEYPAGLDGDYQDPDPLFRTVVGLAGNQIELLDQMTGELTPARYARAALMREFWAQILPGALDREFTGTDHPARSSLRELEIAATRRDRA